MLSDIDLALVPQVFSEEPRASVWECTLRQGLQVLVEVPHDTLAALEIEVCCCISQ